MDGWAARTPNFYFGFRLFIGLACGDLAMCVSWGRAVQNWISAGLYTAHLGLSAMNKGEYNAC